MTFVQTLKRWRDEDNPEEAGMRTPENVLGMEILGALKTLSHEARPSLEVFRTGDSRDDIARYGLCLVLEAAELVNSLPWKRWARHPADLDKAKEEFADMLCFLGSMVCLFNDLGVSHKDLLEAYKDKLKENADRFAKYLEENPNDKD